MSKFDALRMEVSSLLTDQNSYWEKIYQAYGVLPAQFRTYLGLTNEYVVNPKGEKTPIVKVGEYDSGTGEVLVKTPFILKKDGKQIIFDIVLNLCSSEDNDIQLSKLINVRMSRDGEEFYLSADGVTEKTTCYVINGQVEFAPFFDEIYSALLKKLKVR